MDRRVFYEGRGRLVSAVMADASQLAPYVRERELREMAFFEGGTIAERIRLSIERSEKAFAFLSKEGTALILCGVAPIERPAGVSRRLGLLAGRGGLPWALSRPEASGYKLEIVGRAAPVFFREIKAGYDYLTCWAGGWMTELFKLFARHDFFPAERAEYMGETLVRMEWRRM